MADKNQAREEIQKIIQRFREQLEKRAKFNEAETRHYFVLPLFRALGWDTENPSEMSAEEQISRGFVDFGFYLNGVPAFYLETKKIHTDLERDEWAKQAINYSWLRGVTWAALTDFEGMKVFNAEWQERDPQKAIFLDLKWDKYADEQFDDLWLLSKPAIQTGEINQIAERYGKKARKKPVSDLLFAQLTTWRRDLFKEMRTYGNLFKENSQLVDDAVQRFLDRLIFIRTVEDRGVEQPRLQAVIRQYKENRKKDKNLFADLVSLFHELDSVYNAQLFAQTHLDVLEIHDWALLERIIDGLYTAPGGYDRYDFNAINADVLGSMYEQYLSFKATDPTGKEAIDPHKQTKRKSQGIYYTPQFVVRYIVQQTLGKLLAEGADPYKIRVLDPACGSGSFLIEAFDVLDRHLAQHGTEDHRQHPRKRRLHILQNNIYGVDLDPQAVEVARLNLLLRAANERGLLPMLYNIKVGNSLIDDPEIAGETAFNWQKAFPEVFAEGGFDVVIGNPPYGAKPDIKETKYLHEKYSKKSGSYDTYEMFLLRANSLIRANGVIGMIIPSSWMTGEAYTLSRQIFLESLSPQVAYALPFDIFPGAYVDTAIVTFVKNTDKSQTCRVHYFPKKEKLDSIPADVGLTVPVENIKRDKYYRFSVMFSNEITPITSKLERCSDNFGKFFEISRGVQPYSRSKHTEEQIRTQFLHATTPLNGKYLPELQGNELNRYWINPERTSYLEYSENIASSRPVKFFQGERIVLRRLLTRQFRLQASYATETMITTDNIINIIPKKEINVLFALGILNSTFISWFYVGNSLIAQKDDFPQVHLSALQALPLPDASKEKHDCMVSMVEEMVSLKKAHAAAALDDKRHDLAHQIELLDKQIDGLVYELYGLTDAEIAIVEGGNRARQRVFENRIQ